MRKSGFLSTDRLLNSKGETIFKPCNTVAQCIKDTFTFRGKDVTRRVFVEGSAVGSSSSSTPSFMRDWKPNDATKCGIFGVWLSDGNGNGINRMCPGTTTATHYCCSVDVAVAPLMYLFHTYPGVLDELDGVCNKAFSPSASTADRSYPIFSKSKVLSTVASIGRYYAVPMAAASSAQTIKLYMGMLNSLVNEFSPSAGDIPTSKNYVQIVDCSVALYGLLQKYAVCQNPLAPDSGPFCTSYHIRQPSDSGSLTEVAVAYPRSSMYHFLQNTMQVNA